MVARVKLVHRQHRGQQRAHPDDARRDLAQRLRLRADAERKQARRDDEERHRHQRLDATAHREPQVAQVDGGEESSKRGTRRQSALRGPTRSGPQARLDALGGRWPRLTDLRRLGPPCCRVSLQADRRTRRSGCRHAATRSRSNSTGCSPGRSPADGSSAARCRRAACVASSALSAACLRHRARRTARRAATGRAGSRARAAPARRACAGLATACAPARAAGSTARTASSARCSASRRRVAAMDAQQGKRAPRRGQVVLQRVRVADVDELAAIRRALADRHAVPQHLAVLGARQAGRPAAAGWSCRGRCEPRSQTICPAATLRSGPRKEGGRHAGRPGRAIEGSAGSLAVPGSQTMEVLDVPSRRRAGGQGRMGRQYEQRCRTAAKRQVRGCSLHTSEASARSSTKTAIGFFCVRV